MKLECQRADIIDCKAIGRRIREQRISRKYTQEMLAELAGISTSFVGHIERGEKIASLETMARICMVLDESMDYILMGKGIVYCDKSQCILYKEIARMVANH